MEGSQLKADGISMSRIERRYERALAALKAIARAMANAAFRVEDHPGSKPVSDTASSRSARTGEGVIVEATRKTPQSRSVLVVAIAENPLDWRRM
jgi:hypothetical protein